MFRLVGESHVGDDMAGNRELVALEPVNQQSGDVGRTGRRDSQPDSMLLAYKG